MRLKNKVAIVTGAGSGIGRAIAELFAREGARVVIAELDADKGAAAARAIGGDTTFVETDVTQDASVERMAKTAVERCGPISVLVNNAGVLMSGTALTLTEEDWQRCLDVDLKSAWLCARHVIPRIEQAGASIVNIASTHPLRGQPNYFPYAVAKGGVLAMTVSMAVDFGAQGVRVNAICPGLIETPLAAEVLERLRNSPADYERVLAAHPLGRIGTPQDVAYAALFLASEESAFITGTLLIVDGGRTARAYTA